MKILIVEDEDNLQFILEKKLEKAGYSDVSVAKDGKTALEKVKSCKFDIVILDLRLPIISGEEVLKKIKSKKDTKGTYVIVFSVKSGKTEIENIMKLGADKYFTKPDTIDVIIDHINNYVSTLKR